MVEGLEFSKDDRFIASGSHDEAVRVWDTKLSKGRLKIQGHSGHANIVKVSQDGSRVVSSYDVTLRIWDTMSGNEICKLKGHGDWASAVAFSRDGKLIVSGSDNGTVRIWDAMSGNEMYNLKYHGEGVSAVAASEDGNYFTSGSGSGTVQVWDAKTGKEIRRFESRDRTLAIAISKDGNYVASASDNKFVSVWDAKSGMKTHTVRMDFSIADLRLEMVDGARLWLQTNAGTMSLKIHPHRGSVDDCASGETSLAVDSDKQQPSDQQLTSDTTMLGWGLNDNGSWITWCGRRGVWLPPNFRPRVGYSENYISDIPGDGSVIAFGCRSRRVVVLKMSLDPSFS